MNPMHTLPYPKANMIEAPRCEQRGIFTVWNSVLFLIRSLNPQQAAGNALAVAVKGGLQE